MPEKLIRDVLVNKLWIANAFIAYIVIIILVNYQCPSFPHNVLIIGNYIFSLNFVILGFTQMTTEPLEWRKIDKWFPYNKFTKFLGERG